MTQVTRPTFNPCVHLYVHAYMYHIYKRHIPHNYYHFAGFGLLFQPLGNKGVSWHAIRLYFNLYTGPGFFTAILCIINILILVFFFKEFNVHGTKRKRRLIELFSCCRRAIKKNDEGSRMSRMDNDLSQ